MAEYQHLHLDYETFSLLNLKKVGLDNYAKHPSTGISCLSWALDHEEIQIWLPHEGPMPAKLLDALKNPEILLIAWNAAFERNIFKYVLQFDIPITRFRDPMVLAFNLSLPGKLEKVAPILKMKEVKDARGRELIKMFSYPVHMGGEQTLFGISEPLFRTHITHPREFAEYVEYCKQDTRAERDLWYRMVRVPFPETQWRGWMLNQKLNEFGMPGRRDLAEKGLRLCERFLAETEVKLKKLTGLENPNSDSQMKKWIGTRGYPWNSLNAKYVKAELDNPASPITKECREVLTIRSSARKSSYTKMEKFLDLLSTIDDRLRFQFMYMGASRTGRWKSGGGEDSSMQVQNLARGEKAVKEKLALALKLLEAEDYDGIVKEFTNTADPKQSITVLDFCITLLRSLFQAKAGYTNIIVDKNAIENRMLAWAAGCDSMLDVFRHTKEDGGDPYLSFGCKLYNKTYAEMWAKYKSGNEEDRQNSKPAVLGAGYGLGGGEEYINSDNDKVRGGLWGYAKNVCGVDMPKELAHKAVKVFRDSYPEVLQFWTDLEEAFKQVLRRGGIIKVGEVTWDKENKKWVKHPKNGEWCVLTFRRHSMQDGQWMVSIELPSGRRLHYLNATIDLETKVGKKTGNPYTVEQIHYDGIEHSSTQDKDGKQQKKKHKWGRVKTYGGKICENVIQAMSRDDFLESLLLADEMGFPLWGLFHDEGAAEVKIDPFGLRLDDLIWCFVQVPAWAPNLLMGAEGFESVVYKKG
jgi:DNA polymerase bacteriophage-type